MRLPCVVQLGFAGSRRLFEAPPADADERRRLEAAIEQQLRDVLERLPGELGLSRDHFLCGISQLASGADTVFSRVCRDMHDRPAPGALPMVQRLFLPQTLDVFVEAGDEGGAKDFTDPERREARALAGGDHVVQQRVVTDAQDRRQRFEDTNREIVRVSDAVVVLLREGADAGQAGGSRDLLERAVARNVPALLLTVRRSGTSVRLDGEWRCPPASDAPPSDDARELAPQRPVLPEPLSSVAWSEAPGPDGRRELPEVATWCEHVMDSMGEHARRGRQRFAYFAFGIIGTHSAATALATLALIVGKANKSLVLALLGVEVLLLLLGLRIHKALHHRSPTREWATTRLLAEIHRSVRSIGGIRMTLGFLFQIRHPADMRPLFRTLNVLHLHATRGGLDADWESLRDAYLVARLTDPDPEVGQLAYYRGRIDIEARKLGQLETTFLVCTLIAAGATAAKIALKLTAPGLEAVLPPLGFLAVVLPVVAAGGLSWAAGQDYATRLHTYREMLEFLTGQVKRFELATSAREVEHLVQTTEQHLLGETADWSRRRRVLGVA